MSSMNRRSLIGGAAALAGAFAVPSALRAQEASPVASSTPIPPVANSDQFNVLFIRHAESVVNVAPDPNVPDDGVSYPLTQLGMEQLAELNITLANVDFSAIYTSTRVRCIQTATGLALNHNLTINLAPAIVEVRLPNFNELDGNEVGAVFAAWGQGDLSARVGDGESAQDMVDRFVPFVTETIDQYKDQPKTLVFVAHGGVLFACLPELFANVSHEFALMNQFANTGIASGTFVDGELVCTSWQGVAPQ